MNFKNIICITILIIIVILLIGTYMFKNAIRGDINSISIEQLTKSNLEFIRDNYKNLYSISKDQAQEIIENPTNYVYLSYECTLRNNLILTKASDLQFIASFSDKIASYVIGYTKIGPLDPITINPRTIYKTKIFILIKKSALKNINYFNNGIDEKFIITGRILGMESNIGTLKFSK